MARAKRFGAFGGVFTPSVLTILGVIMYMRLPRIVGEGGLWLVLGIIFAAHVISVTTGLSVASIATDKKVEAGGPYYIVSRSLGLPIGGTLGLALYIGLSFSISLYVIGFVESLLPMLGYAPDDKEMIRLIGSVTLVGVTSIILISTSFAIRVQYLIMAAIALSIIGILFGSHDLAPQSGLALEPSPDGRDLPLLFAIFFPAVTGFTAGVNMSGDLKDPRRALPLGTIAAIGTGLLTYVGLAVFLAVTVDRAALVDNPDVLLDIAVEPWMVLAGVWGATISSAIGSILGAPRILQAKSKDRLTPRFFAKGRGASNEPRNALLLTFGIAEAGILIGELDVIASVVSMFFIMTYGFLNIACAFESWVSPDFRPDFRIPIWVSVLGAVACVVVMIQLNFLAMIAAAAVLLGLFLVFKRRELNLDGGDAWSGVWASLVRSGLRRLEGGEGHHRNWRPNVMLFSSRAAPSRAPLLAFTDSLMSGRGIVTDFELIADAAGPHDAGAALAEPASAPPREARPGVFHRPTPTADPYDTIDHVCRYYGFSGVEPNTVMLDWAENRRAPERFVELLDSVRARDLNLIVLGHDPDRSFGRQRRIDVWSAGDGANMSLSLALVRFISASAAWRQCDLRFFIASEDAGRAERLRRSTQRVLEDNRIQARVSAAILPDTDGAFEDRVGQLSAEADLIIASLPAQRRADPQRWATRTEELIRATDGSLLLIRASRRFEDAFRRHSGYAAPVAPKAELIEAIEAPVVAADTPELALPAPTALASEAQRLADGVEQLFESLHRDTLTALHAHHLALLDDLEALVGHHLDLLERGLAADAPAPRRRALARAQRDLLAEAERRLDDFERLDLVAQMDVVRGGVATSVQGLLDLRVAAPGVVPVTRPPSDFDPDPDDPPRLRRLKRRRRLGAWLARRPPRYRVHPTPAAAYAVEHLGVAEVERTLARHARLSYRAAPEAARIIADVAAHLGELDKAVGSGGAHGGDGGGPVARERKRALGAIAALRGQLTGALAADRQSLARAAREIAQIYADDLDRLDFARHVRRARRVPQASRAAAEALPEAPARWEHNLRLLLHGEQTALRIASYQRRLRAITERTRAQVVHKLTAQVVAPMERLAAEVGAFRAALETDAPAALEVSHGFRQDFDADPIIDALGKETQAATAELPEEVETASSDALRVMDERPFDEADKVSVSVQRLVGYLVEAELVSVLQHDIAAIPVAERAANRVAQDVVRLITYSASDLTAGPEGAPLKADAAARAQLAPVVDTALARIGAEIERLRALGPELERDLASRLAVVTERTDAFTTAGAVDQLKQYVRKPSARRPLGERVGAGLVSVGRAVNKGVVEIVYRRSLGVLLARRLKPALRDGDAMVGRALALVEACSPRPEVEEALPFYYRQLFLGRSANDSAFWVGRDEALAEAAGAVGRHRAGRSGALVVVGSAGAGKSALIQMVARTHFEASRVFRVQPPPGGSVDVAAFHRALRVGLKVRGGVDELLGTLPERSAVVLEDASRWWERSEGGLAVIDEVLRLIDRFGERCLFVIELDTRVFRAIGRFRELAGKALAVVECGPVDSRTLRSIIELRHRSTGLSFELEGRLEDALGDLARARLFARAFDDARGLVGPALQGWIAAIQRVEGDVLKLRAPRAVDDGVLEDLPVGLQAILVQLVLHRALTVPRLERVTGLSAEALAGSVATLTRMGLVERDGEGVVVVNRFVKHRVSRHLDARGWLP